MSLEWVSLPMAQNNKHKNIWMIIIFIIIFVLTIVTIIIVIPTGLGFVASYGL